MESENQKWVTLSFVAAGALVGFILFNLFSQVAGIYDLEARVQNADLMITGLSVLIGAIVFFVLYRRQDANQFVDEAVVELSRVTWPTSNDTSKATIVVVVMVLISGAVLGGFDSLWTWLIGLVL